MYDDLFDLMLDGAFANKKEFDNFVNEATPEEIFSLVIEGAFADIDEFKSMYNVDLPEVKKKDELVSTSQEEVTESVTPTEQEEVGSLVSSAPSPLEERQERERIKAKEYEQSVQESQFERAEFDINEDARASLQQSVEIVDRGDYKPSNTEYRFEDESNVTYAPIDVRTSGYNKEYNNNIKQIESIIESSKKELLKTKSTFRGKYPPYIKEQISDRKQLLNKFESDLIKAKEQHEKDKEYTASLIESESGSLKEKQQLESKAYDEMSLDKYYVNGTRREDIKTFIPSLQNQVDIRFNFVKGDEYQRLKEDYDVVIDKVYQEKASKAATDFKLFESNLTELKEQAISTFGVPISSLHTIEYTSQEDFDEANRIVTESNNLHSTQELIVSQYIEASTWFDVKFDKQLQSDIVENWEGFKNNLSVGYNRGKAAEQILKVSLGLEDLGDEDTLEDIANAIVEASKEGNTGKTNRVLNRWAASRGFAEGWKVFADDPFELMGVLAGESFAQVSPYGWKMVLTGTLSGLGTGALIGATGFVTGGGGVVTTGAGALAGAGYGAKTSFAASMFAMEYTNAVFEAMGNQDPDFDITNPASVQKGLLNPEVWAEGKDIGFRRGIPIALVDFLSAHYAGTILKAGRLASMPVKIAAFSAETILVHPTAEGFGEFLAQVVSGQDISMKEIVSESLGSIGMSSVPALLNIASKTATFNKLTIAQDLATLEGMAKETASPLRISTWSNNMENAGRISPEQNQRIQENIGLKREAQDAFVTPSYFTEKVVEVMLERVYLDIHIREKI